MPEYRTIAINGEWFIIPADELADPHPEGGGDCPWFDKFTEAVCTVPEPHPDEFMHIAHDAEGMVIAMFDTAHGHRLSDEEAVARVSAYQRTSPTGGSR